MVRWREIRVTDPQVDDIHAASFQILLHSARAIAPSVPAAASILLLRAVTDLDRSVSLAFAELGLYLLVTVVATWALERPLLREVVGYLRAAPRPA